jgi:hypothetical protein
MAVPTLLYGSGNWMMTERGIQKLQTAEIQFLRSVKGCTRLDKIWKEDTSIRNEFGAISVNDRKGTDKIGLNMWKR